MALILFQQHQLKNVNSSFPFSFTDITKHPRIACIIAAMNSLSLIAPPLVPGQWKRREKPLEFSDLPTEIRSEIWRLAIPKSRILRVKAELGSSSASLIGPFSPVPTILHVCQESRRFGLSVFRRGFQDISNGLNDFYWNPSIDTLYLVPFGEENVRSYLIPYHTIPLETLPDAQHLAFPLTGMLFLGMSRTDSPLINWLATIPSLQTICFVIEPMFNWLGILQWWSQEIWPSSIQLPDDRYKSFHPPSAIVLYEPVETHVYGYGSNEMPPALMETTIRRVISEVWDSTHPRMAPPVIEVLVMGAKRFKNSGFCLPCPRNLRPWELISPPPNGDYFRSIGY
jgi:hypothetical protein